MPSVTSTETVDPNRLTRDEVAAELERWDAFAWMHANRACKKFKLSADNAPDVHAEIILCWCRAARRYRKDRGANFGTYVNRFAWSQANNAAYDIVRRGLKITREEYEESHATTYSREETSEMLQNLNNVNNSVARRGERWVDPEDRGDGDPDRWELWDLVRAALSDREWFVVESRLLLGRKLHDVGRALKVSKERVRQIQNKAMGKLKEALPGWGEGR